MEEVCGRRHVSAGERPVPRRGQQTRAMDPDLSPVVVHRPQLCQDQEGLLQVIAEDLLVFAHALRGGTLGPGHELLMELSPAPLEKALVGGILDQPMEERIALLAGEPVLVWLDELPPYEARQARSDMLLDRIGDQVLHGAVEEDLADHRPSFDHRSVGWAQSVVSGCEPGT